MHRTNINGIIRIKNNIKHTRNKYTSCDTFILFHLRNSIFVKKKQLKIVKMELKINHIQHPKSLLPDIRKRRGGHIDHVAFNVDDIDTAFQTLKTAL